MGARAGNVPPAGPEPGTVLDKRYELDQIRAEQRLTGDGRSVLWRAVDGSLDRYVAIRTVSGLDEAARERLLEAAARSSRLSDARFVRVLDVGVVGRQKEVVWLATEWVEAPSLAAVIRDEPMRPAVATDLARQCTEALLAAERDGLRHGRLHADQVLLPPDGSPRLTDLTTAAVIHAGSPTDYWDDVHGVAALLFAGVTSRWPLPGWRGLPAADERAAGQGRPRLLRAGISRELDDVTHRALSGETTELGGLLRGLSALPAESLDRPAPPAARTETSELRRWLWRIVPPVVVLAVGVTGWALGSDLGRVPTSARQAEAGLPAKKATVPGHGKAGLVWHRPPDIIGFDPDGDQEENDDEAPLAVDRDRTTAWHTALYRDSSHLGGLKPGVGLLVDLGRPRRVRFAEVALTAPGATFEVRAGNDAPSRVDDLRLVDTRNRAGARARLTVEPAVSARYWLLWFTNLPPDDGGFRVGVAEVALLG